MTKNSQENYATNKPRSSCCNADLKIHEGEEGTNCFICSACNLPCDPAPTCPHTRIHTERLMKSLEEPYKKVIVSYCALCGLELSIVDVYYEKH